MAERKLKGDDLLLFLDPAGGTTYSTIVCLTANSYERTANEIDATSKCGTDVLSGTKSRTVSFEGQVLFDPATGKISEEGLNDIFEDDTVVGWKIAEATPTTGSVTYAGTARLMNLTIDASLNSPTTFSGSLKVIGVPTKTVTP